MTVMQRRMMFLSMGMCSGGSDESKPAKSA
jgi:hypothetical protein